MSSARVSLVSRLRRGVPSGSKMFFILREILRERFPTRDGPRSSSVVESQHRYLSPVQRINTETSFGSFRGKRDLSYLTSRSIFTGAHVVEGYSFPFFILAEYYFILVDDRYTEACSRLLDSLSFPINLGLIYNRR